MVIILQYISSDNFIVWLASLVIRNRTKMQEICERELMLRKFARRVNFEFGKFKFDGSDQEIRQKCRRRLPYRQIFWQNQRSIKIPNIHASKLLNVNCLLCKYWTFFLWTNPLFKQIDDSWIIYNPFKMQNTYFIRAENYTAMCPTYAFNWKIPIHAITLTQDYLQDYTSLATNPQTFNGM